MSLPFFFLACGKHGMFFGYDLPDASYSAMLRGSVVSCWYMGNLICAWCASGHGVGPTKLDQTS
jgi:hypothetical protein